jgi:hypothetical protein
VGDRLKDSVGVVGAGLASGIVLVRLLIESIEDTERLVVPNENVQLRDAVIVGIGRRVTDIVSVAVPTDVEIVSSLLLLLVGTCVGVGGGIKVAVGDRLKDSVG